MAAIGPSDVLITPAPLVKLISGMWAIRGMTDKDRDRRDSVDADNRCAHAESGSTKLAQITRVSNHVTYYKDFISGGGRGIRTPVAR